MTPKFPFRIFHYYFAVAASTAAADVAASVAVVTVLVERSTDCDSQF